MKEKFPMAKAVLLITSGLFITVLLLYFNMNIETGQEGKKVKIMDTWELPEILEEVSGIAYFGDKLMACVQDEEGIIFIYDLEKRIIVREIAFAGSGDYESITIGGDTAYILRSDGAIFEIGNFLSANPVNKLLYTPEDSGKNFEGLEFDGKNNRLLISIKESTGKENRPIYGFDLKTQQMVGRPVFNIAFSDPVFSELGKKPSEKFIKPSEISIHPKSGKIYILEGMNPKILILNRDGKPEKIHLLNRKQFRQAEGLTFGENGEIYISNEGNRTPANILQISLN